jgi:HAD superfamily hydrolase (TIGR01509 family)
MTAPEFVIFDCDGVLVDSEPISIRVLTEIIGEAGVTISADQAYREFLGRSMASIVKALSERYGVTMTGMHLEAIRSRLYSEFEKSLSPVKGVKTMLSALQLPNCVASSSQPERIRLTLRKTGLLDYFEPRLFSSAMVKKGKPAPDLFLYAARCSGVRAESCVVIEDSPAGIEAAKSAGMRVFGFTGGSHAAPAGLKALIDPLKPDLIFDDMKELPALLAGLVG